MIPGFVNEAFEAIGAQLKSLFSPLFGSVSDYVYISEWWLGFAAVLFVCLVIARFLPFKWVRVGLGFVVWTALVAAWVATVVWRHMRNEKKPLAPKLAESTKPRQRDSWFQ